MSVEWGSELSDWKHNEVSKLLTSHISKVSEEIKAFNSLALMIEPKDYVTHAFNAGLLTVYLQILDIDVTVKSLLEEAENEAE